ncbi:toxin RelE [Candidatus Magnetomorum sp. HK-1]|nr:toxin RelE [Candidatus Magnetomorum sp. HK-1]
MARALRIEYPNAFYHVLSRGNDRRNIFISDHDRLSFLETLKDFADRFDIEIFAYVLMDNHYHLILKTHHANLSKSMQWLGTTYTRRFNVSNNRSGHLFQGRYKSLIVENDSYLLRLSCYIHRNPLRAQMVKRLIDFKWSSYLAYAYDRKHPEWLNTKFLLDQFVNVSDKHKSYRLMLQKYSNKEKEKKLLEDIRHGIIIGSEKFVDHIKSVYLKDEPDIELPQAINIFKNSNSLLILEQAAELIKCDLEKLKKKSRVSKTDQNKRDLLIYLLWKSGKYSNNEIGDIFGLTYSSISKRKTVVLNKLNDEKQTEVHALFEDIKSLIKV